MSTTRAWTHIHRGPPSTVLTLSSLPTPPLSPTVPNQLLIRISHCALNPGASIMMHLLPTLLRTTPAVPELDFAGTITALSATGNKGFCVGVPVFGSIPVAAHLKGAGALAGYVVLDSATVAAVPGVAGVKDEGEVERRMREAAGLGVVGCTALALMKAAGLGRGDAVLVNGASGGIGHLVVQMCREAVGESGRVVGVCSAGNAEMVRGLGADEVVDYCSHAPVHRYLKDRFGGERFNCVIDAFGVQELFENCEGFLAEGKPYVTVGVAFEDYTFGSMLAVVGSMLKNLLWPRLLGGVPRNYVQVTGVANKEGMQELAEMVGEGKLRVVADECFEFGDALKAYERMLSRRAKGKIVVKVQEL